MKFTVTKLGEFYGGWYFEKHPEEWKPIPEECVPDIITDINRELASKTPDFIKLRNGWDAEISYLGDPETNEMIGIYLDIFDRLQDPCGENPLASMGLCYEKEQEGK